MRRMLFLVLLGMVYGQDNTELFWDYLPQKVTANTYFLKTVDKKIDLYAQTDLGLIYFYLQQLRLKYDKQITNPDSNYTNTLKARWNQSKAGQFAYITKNRNRAIQTIDQNGRRKKVLSYFGADKKEAEPDPMHAPDLPINENLQEFFSYKWLSRQIDLKYDPAKMYAEMVDTWIDRHIDTLSAHYELAESLTLEIMEEDIRFAFNHPYIFKDGYLKRFLEQTSFLLYELITRYVEVTTLPDLTYQQRIDGVLSFSVYNLFEPVLPSVVLKILTRNYPEWNARTISAGYLEYGWDITRRYTYTHPYFTSKTVTLPYSFQSEQVRFVSVAFKQQLRENRSVFSSISLKYSHAFAIKKSGDLDRITWEGWYGKPGLRWDGRYYTENFRDFESKAYTAQAQVTLFDLFSVFSVEAGVFYYYQTVRYDFDFICEGDYSSYWGVPIPVPEHLYEKKEEHVKLSYEKVFPLLVLQLTPWKFIHLQSEFLLPDDKRYSAGLSLPF